MNEDRKALLKTLPCVVIHTNKEENWCHIFICRNSDDKESNDGKYVTYPYKIDKHTRFSYR